MSKAIFAALTVVLLRDCDLAAPRPAGGVVTGTWGGDNAGLMADDTSSHTHIACTFGNVHQAIVLDANGRFDVPGEYVLRAYPVYVGPTLPARYQGPGNAPGGWGRRRRDRRGARTRPARRTGRSRPARSPGARCRTCRRCACGCWCRRPSTRRYPRPTYPSPPRPRGAAPRDRNPAAARRLEQRRWLYSYHSR